MKYLKKYNESLSEDFKLGINDILEEVKDYDLVYKVSIHENVYPGYDRIMINIYKDGYNRNSSRIPSWVVFNYDKIRSVIEHLVSYLNENGYKENKISRTNAEGYSNSVRSKDIGRNSKYSESIVALDLYFGTK